VKPAGALLPGRVHRAELMDVEPTSDADLARCLADLERVNRWSLGYRPTLRWLDAVTADRDRLSVLDVGCGHGDMLRRIRRWGRRRGLALELWGLDASPAATRAARRATPSDMAVRFETGELFAWAPPQRFDVVVSALFAHHLGDADLVRFFAWMEAHAEYGWFVNDLHRHALAYHGLRLGFSLFSVHRFVRHDGPVSVHRAFTRRDFAEVAAAAGLDPADLDVAWWFPFRWGVGRRKEPS
jgi:SAM-dependent methyltransferase